MLAFPFRFRYIARLMSPLRLILNTKAHIAWNYLAHLKRHMAVHLGAFLMVLAALIGGGYWFFHFVFRYLMELEVIGEPLMNHLTGMVLTTFFAMLVFSNLIVTLSTAYISREVDFYMAMPVARPTIFFLRLIESTVYSSWGFFVLSLPLISAFGAVRHVGMSFYAIMLLLTLFFLLIPAGIGALVTMVISSLFPARKTFRMVILLGALGIASAVAMGRIISMQTAISPNDLSRFNQILGILKVGTAPTLPSAWLMRGMLAAADGQWNGFWQGQGVWYWLALLASTGLFLIQLCAWLAPRIYYRGWRLAGETSSARRGEGVLPFLSKIDPLLSHSGLSPQLRAIVSKDIKTFWRDPAQWSQLMILFGLLFIYVANLRSVARFDPNFTANPRFWVILMSFFNMGAGCFVLTILTTRFVYPILSLEGKQFWTIGLAPLKRETLVWEKYWLCWAAAFCTTGALMLFSNLMLRVSGIFISLSLANMVVLSFGLTSLSVGLGALTPNFREDNPARIANGLGGTMNIILSLLYVGLVLALEFWPVFLSLTNKLARMEMRPYILSTSIAGLVIVNALVIIVPMRMGLRHWRELEF